MTLDDTIKYFEDCYKDGHRVEMDSCAQHNAEMFSLEMLKEKRAEDIRKEDFKLHHSDLDYFGKFADKNNDVITHIMNSLCCRNCDGLERYGCAGCQKEFMLIEILLENYNSFK